MFADYNPEMYNGRRAEAGVKVLNDKLYKVVLLTLTRTKIATKMVTFSSVLSTKRHLADRQPPVNFQIIETKHHLMSKESLNCQFFISFQL